LQSGGDEVRNDAILWVFWYYLSSKFYLIEEDLGKKEINSFLLNENIIASLLVIISFCVYLITMSRSVGLTDSGELAAVIYTLGIAHPTGYPLFTLLGRIWIMLPIQMEEIIRLNIFSALLTSVSVGIFFKSSIAIIRSATLFQFKNQKRNNSNDLKILFSTGIASLTLGFSTTFWSQSSNIEVYALHLVLILLTIWTFIRGMEEQVGALGYISNILFLFAFILGLSFSNHMTTILLAPGFLWLFFRTFGRRRETFRLILKLLPFFLIGLSIYLYLPIRSANNPLLDWGHPASIERFLWHVTGKQFRVWMFSAWDVAQKQLNYYFYNFTSEYSAIAVVIVFMGIITSWKQSKRLFIFIFLLFISTIIYSVNYDIFDIDNYFLLSYIVVAWLLVFGIQFLINRSEEKRFWIKILIIGVLIFIPIVQIVLNRGKCNESKCKLPQEFVENAFHDLEPNAVVIASQWDYFISPALYYQNVRNERQDITIIDKSLLQNRSWYFLQLENHSKWLMDRIQPRAKAFLIDLNKFEKDFPFDYNSINTNWQYLLEDIVEKSLIDRPVYVDVRITNEFSSKYRRTPNGLFVKISRRDDTVAYKHSDFLFSPINDRNAASKDFEQYFITVLLNEANWLFSAKKLDSAQTILKEILRIEPSNFSAKWLSTKIVSGK
jgi:hypothetical protein